MQFFSRRCQKTKNVWVSQLLATQPGYVVVYTRKSLVHLVAWPSSIRFLTHKHTHTQNIRNLLCTVKAFFPYRFAFVVFTITSTATFFTHLLECYLQWHSNRIPKRANIEGMSFSNLLLVTKFSAKFWICVPWYSQTFVFTLFIWIKHEWIISYILIWLFTDFMFPLYVFIGFLCSPDVDPTETPEKYIFHW